jgi:phage tail sheath protein FI
MSLTLGINLLETNGTATPSIQGASTSVAAFIVRSQRGVPGAVRQLTMFADYTNYFGGYAATAFGAYCIRGFFDNGGATAYVTRAVATAAATGVTAAVAASVGLTSGTGTTVVTDITVTAAYRGSADPGLWGNSLSIGVTSNSDGTFNLIVMQAGSTQPVETWSKLKVGTTGAQDPHQINDAVAGSRYIMVTVAATATNPAPTVDTSNNPIFEPLTNGSDDNLDNATNTAAGAGRDTALQALIASGLLDPFDIQLLMCPETSTASVVEAALTYCSNRGDCMYIGYTPLNNNAGAAKTYGQGLQGDKVYGAIYFPFIQVANPLGGYIFIPPVGHVAGVYARTALERGIWKAPAGSAASVENALNVAFSISDVTHTDLVKNGSVCAIRNISGVGIVIDSSRTLSTNPLWLYVNVRLLFNYVKSSLKAGLRWTVQEPNDTTLWNKAKYNSIVPFLMGLYRRGAFGPGKPSDVFTVKIDAENNPPANIQQGIFTIDVFFYPSRPAETIVITVGQQDSGGTSSES